MLLIILGVVFLNITGSIYVKNDIYQMMVRIPDDDGRYHQKSKTTKIPIKGKSQRETDANKKRANKMLAAWIVELEELGSVPSGRMLMDSIMEWLDRHKASIRLNTWECYCAYVEKHIRPFFEPKRLKLADVTSRHIQRYIDVKHKEGQSTQSIKKHMAVLNGVFNEAVKFREIKYNPCSAIEYPKAKKYKPTVYDASQAELLLKAIKGDPVETPVMIGLYLGLRRSEVAGLRWDDIDFKNNLIHIRNTLVRFVSLLEEEHTKSENSERDLVMPKALRGYLLALQDVQRANKEMCGGDYQDSGHVCQWPDGSAYKPDYISARFRKLLKKHGLPHIRFHDLRHTAGSLLYKSTKNVKQVQNFLGHQDITTTLNIYVHDYMEDKVEMANAMDELLPM